MSNLIRLRRLARWLSGLTIAAFVLVILATILSVGSVLAEIGISSAPVAGEAVIGLFPGATVSAEIPAVLLWAALALHLPGLLVLLLVLRVLNRLFICYAEGEILTERVAALIRRIGQGLLALAALPLIVGPLQSVLLSLSNPQGDRVLAVGITEAEIGFLLAGGLMTLIGWAMAEAARLADENRSFV